MTDAAPSIEAPPAAPAVGWATGPLGAVQAADREIGRQTALRARAVAEFAATRPACADRPAGTPGAMSAERRAARPSVLADVSEWAAQELVVALSITSTAAQNLLERSLTLVHRLPRTLAALESGLIHVGHLWSLLERVAPITDATIRTRVEAEVIDWTAARQVTTPAQLGAKVRRSVLRHDARAAAQRLAAAVRERGITVRADRREGMAVFDSLLTVPEAHALLDVLGQYADVIDGPEDTRTRGQRMADCLLDLVLRPGEQTGPPVQARLTVVAGVRTLAGGDEPGEIGGEPVPAELVRALARALGLLPHPPSEPVASAAAGLEPRPDELPVDSWTDAVCAADERWWAEVEARALRGVWGGEEDPSLQELERWWAMRAAVPDDAPPPPEDGAADDDSTTDTTVATGAWARADRAVDEASALLLELQRASSRAGRAVADAVRADADDEDAWEQSPAGRMTAATGTVEALGLLTDGQRAALADLLDATAGGGLLDRPRIAVVDELTGALLCLTDADGLRRQAACGRRRCRRDPGSCDHGLSGRHSVGPPGLGPPGPGDGYRPGAALDRHLRARDRRCRFPGCRRPVPLSGELDHDRPWPEGPTSAGNLVGYCTGHHRGKHQAPGWRHQLAEDGTLTITTPTGLVATTTPPPY
ncbi:protein of unknown function [Blastococcus aurantiacus]|uniref:DUF222 domain-containing protein n=1 Tax=Blastococcus aurantiacus TaxID=1550231 RepID=A0A1G7KLG2_9ACTN|nr:HNH endonuclease signature motif containing protein [Blastococcus aurantiacus]SDF37884.1 protein of unknown function [Blastococcus aurantiacus]